MLSQYYYWTVPYAFSIETIRANNCTFDDIFILLYFILEWNGTW
jgi:hypothetical protein